MLAGVLLASLGWRRTWRVAAFLAGVLWGSLNTSAFLAQRPALLQGQQASQIRGAVDGLAQSRDGAWAFELRRGDDDGAQAHLARLRYAVVGYAGPRPPPGAWCVLHVRLRRPHSLLNPGARDGERALAARRIGAQARVIAHPGNLCVDINAPRGLATWRARLARAIDAAVAAPAAAAVLRALTVADRGGLDERQWTLVRATGTAHLLAISGLHVSLAAVLAFGLVRCGVALVGWRYQGYPAVRAGWLAAAAAACLYAGLAGWGVPAQRATAMVLVAVAAVLGGRRALSWDGLALALTLIATLDPFALLSESLWLSFTAVAVLIATASRAPHRGGWLARAGRTHVYLALGMAPLAGGVFGAIPLAAPLANLVAVPWCSLLVVPLTLAAALLYPWAPGLAEILWNMAARLWLWLESGLGWVAGLGWELPAAWLAGHGGLLPAAAGLALLTLPRGLGARTLAWLLLASVLCTRPPAPAGGCYVVSVLDVGQGLAVVVRTARHTLLYDTGPRWWSGRDAGTSVVVPALARLGTRHLDAVVISHADSDHAGGLAAVRAAYPMAPLHAPTALGDGRPVHLCDRPLRWRWDEVDFLLFSAPLAPGASRNDASCVLAIAGRDLRVLLSGDIERQAEAALIAHAAQALPAAVLVVPHHGSATSSSAAFIAAVAPRIAIIPVGAANRYGMPHADVLARYRAAGVTLYDTARDGALEISGTAAAVHVRATRDRRFGFWRGSAPLSSTERVW